MQHLNGNGHSAILGSDGRPARQMGMGSEYGQFAVPPVITFGNLVGRTWHSYWLGRQDQAMRAGREEAKAMENDAYLMALLNERKHGTAALKWRIDVDNERDPYQKAVKIGLTKVVKATPNFFDLNWCLLDGIWYGRQAQQVVYEYRTMPLPMPGQPEQTVPTRALCIKQHRPVRGDKISFHWDGTPYLQVHGSEGLAIPDAETFPSNAGRAIDLKGTWRTRFIIHTHEWKDADFFDAEAGDSIYGIGIRSVLFWLNWLRQEGLAHVLDWVERTGLGIRLWYYQGGNDRSKQEVKLAAETQTDKTNILVPRWGDKAVEGVDYVDTASTGADLLLKIQEHMEEHIERYVIGQTLSSSSEGNGLGGTGVADLHADTKSKIIAADAARLDDNESRDWIEVVKRWTYPWADFPVRIVRETEQPDPEKTMAAIKNAREFGVDFKEDSVRDLTGMEAPQPGDRTLDSMAVEKQQAQAAQQQQAMGQQLELARIRHPEMSEQELQQHVAGGEPGQPPIGKPGRDGQGPPDPDDEEQEEDDGEGWPFSRLDEPARYGFDPNEKRDESGEWTAGGAGGTGGSSKAGGQSAAQVAGQASTAAQKASRTTQTTGLTSDHKEAADAADRASKLAAKAGTPEAHKAAADAHAKAAAEHDRRYARMHQVYDSGYGGTEGNSAQTEREKHAAASRLHKAAAQAHSIASRVRTRTDNARPDESLRYAFDESKIDRDEAGKFAEHATHAIHERAKDDPTLSYADIAAHVEILRTLPKAKLKEIAAIVHVHATSATSKEALLKQIHDSIAGRKGRTERTTTPEERQKPKEAVESMQDINARLLGDRKKSEAAHKEQLAKDEANLKAPIAAEVYKKQEGHESAKLPDNIFDTVRQALAALQGHEKAAAHARATDRQFGGEGRYESEFFNSKKAPSESAKTIETFKELAADNDIDASKVIAEMGGIPETKKSTSAVSWETPQELRPGKEKPKEAGPHSPALEAMAPGDLKRVGGWMTRRTGKDSWRIDTDEGHVEGDAAKVHEHIGKHDALAKLEGRKYHEALTRGTGDDTDKSGDLPHGSRVVSLHPETHGRVGTVHKTPEGNRVKLDNEPGWASGHVEPLDEGLSWRKGATAAKAEHSDAMKQAFEDWNARRAYLDNAGNYHLREESATPTHSTRGKIAPWNKEVKAAFKGNEDFHKAAKEHQAKKAPSIRDLAPAPKPPAKPKVDVEEESQGNLYGDTTQRQGKLFQREEEPDRYSVEWVRAPTGGATSPVNGVFYDGGRFMPIHGKSDKEPGKKGKPRPTRERKAMNRFGEYVSVPEDHIGIDTLCHGHPAKSKNLSDTAFAYMGLTKKQVSDLADIWESDGGSATVPREIVPPSAFSTQAKFDNDWSIKDKWAEHQKNKGEARRKQDADGLKAVLEEEKATAPKPKEDDAPPAGELFQRRDDAERYAKDGGRWITIGAVAGEDGKKHGGSPVFVQGGVITKGHPRLTGQKLGSIGKEPERHVALKHKVMAHLPKSDNLEALHAAVKEHPREHVDEALEDLHKSGHVRVHAPKHGSPRIYGTGKAFTEEPDEYNSTPTLTGTKRQQAGQKAAQSRQQNTTESEYQRAVWAKKARQAGIPSENLHELASQVMAHDKEMVTDRIELLRAARKAMDEFGGQHKTIAANQSKGGTVGDHTTMKGIDQAAQELYSTYPHLFHPEDGEHGSHDEQLYEMLKEGNPQAMSEDDAYGQALEHLQEMQAGATPSTEPWQMTKDDHLAAHPGLSAATKARDAAQRGNNLAAIKNSNQQWGDEYDKAEQEHAQHVQAAVAAGKAVPPEVLDDYPDLEASRSEADESQDIASSAPTSKGNRQRIAEAKTLGDKIHESASVDVDVFDPIYGTPDWEKGGFQHNEALRILDQKYQQRKQEVESGAIDPKKYPADVAQVNQSMDHAAKIIKTRAESLAKIGKQKEADWYQKHGLGLVEEARADLLGQSKPKEKPFDRFARHDAPAQYALDQLILMQQLETAVVAELTPVVPILEPAPAASGPTAPAKKPLRYFRRELRSLRRAIEAIKQPVTGPTIEARAPAIPAARKTRRTIERDAAGNIVAITESQE